MGSRTVQPIRVGLLGLGTVGGGVVEILSRHGPLIAQRTGIHLQVVRACVRNRQRKRQGSSATIPLTTLPSDIINADDIDIVAELAGGIEPARQWVHDALLAGKPVVTANKALMAAHGPSLFRAAAKAECDVYFEAAVAGGIPIIRTLREGLASDKISELIGILNGTTNFILDKMTKEGWDYHEALKRAQQEGYAEADPTLDVGGRDAADKLSILALLAFGTRVAADKIPTEGIEAITADVIADAKRLGFGVKLLGIARRVADGLDLRVHPTMIPPTHPLYNVPDAQNAIAIASDALGATLYQGAGAGGLPTGNSVVADLIEVARNLRAGINGRVTERRLEAPPKVLPKGRSESAFYIRLKVAEQPGVLASITKILAAQGVSLETVLQLGRGTNGAAVPVVLTTHPAQLAAIDRALKRIAGLDALRTAPQMIRIAASQE